MIMKLSSVRRLLPVFLLTACAFLLSTPTPATAQEPGGGGGGDPGGCIVCPPGGGEGGGTEPPPLVLPHAVIQTEAEVLVGSGSEYPLQVRIEWCQGSWPLAPGTHRIRLGALEVTGRFTFVRTGFVGCEGNGAVSQGTLHLPRGTSTLTAEICDEFSNCSNVEQAHYSYATEGVVVGPKDRLVQAAAGSQGTEWYTITNAGSAAVEVTWRASCAGDGIATCAAVGTGQTIPAGESRPVRVDYRAGAEGKIGSISLRVTSATSQAVDEGLVHYSVPATSGTPQRLSVNLTNANAGETPQRSLCMMLPAGPGAGYECGDLRVAHAAPAVMTLGRAHAPVLTYNSDHAQPQVVVRANVTLPQGGLSPDRVVVRLRVGGVVRASREYAGGEWTPKLARRIAVGFPALDLATGFHDYTLEVTPWYGERSDLVRTVSGVVAVVNRSQSPYGAGWWVAGLETLDVGTMTWVGGDGSMRRYVPAGPGRWSAPSVTRPDTLERDAAGNYRRLLPGGAYVHFDAQGKHVATVGRTAETRFTYVGERLNSILVPTAEGEVRSHQFDYATWAPGEQRLIRVRRYDETGSITTSNRHAVRFGHGHADRRVTVITDPDQHRIEFEYADAAAPNRITERRDRLGVPTTYTYDAAGKLTRASTHMGAGQEAVAVQYQAAESRGWQRSVPESAARLEYDGPRRDVLDVVSFRVNRHGAPTLYTDPYGRLTRYAWHAQYPGLIRRVQGPGGQVTLAEYDVRGNVRTVQDSTHWRMEGGVRRHATTTYAYDDARWPDFVTRIIAPAGEETRIGYDPQTGNRIWQTDARGDTAKAVFVYTPNGRLLASVQTPEGRWKGAQPQRMAYDAQGNLARSTSPLGYYTETRKDALGRDTAVYTPSSDAPDQPLAARTVQRATYDFMDRPTMVRSVGPAREEYVDVFNGTLPVWIEREEVVVVTGYDAEGRTTRVSRESDPDPAKIGVTTNRYVYDNLGRMIEEISPDGLSDRLTLDPAGNVVARTSRRGLTVTMRYDAAGRLEQRITPGIVLSTRSAWYPNPWLMPLYKAQSDGTFGAYSRQDGGLVIPADTATFRYDLAGRLEVANNRDARITRTYTTSGLLQSERQRIRPYHGNDFRTHDYTLTYAYDLNGRRTELHHPRRLAVEGDGHLWRQAQDPTTQYRYSGLGELERVTDPLGHGVNFRYDLNGGIHTSERGSTRETLVHDDDGRLLERSEFGGGPGRRDHYTYDGRGRILTVDSRVQGDRVENTYTGIGALAFAYSQDMKNNTWSVERYYTDALANTDRVMRRSGKLDEPGISWYGSLARENTYQRGTGRLLRGSGGDAGGNSWQSESWYDAAGNKDFESGTSILTGVEWDGLLVETTAFFYDAADRLRVLDRRACMVYLVGGACVEADMMDGSKRSAFEEHRYDALGRRMMLRTRQEAEGYCYSRATCFNAVVRTVWDGDQILYEISAPGRTDASNSDMDDDNPPLPPSLGGGHFYGRVQYTHAHGIDLPVLVTRMGYSQDLNLPITMWPLTNWAGRFDAGEAINGCVAIDPDPGVEARFRPITWAPGEPGYTEDPEDPDGPGQRLHCIEPNWPANKVWSSLAQKPGAAPRAWVGSLIQHGRDPSGQYYRRNRFYDAQSGRFTQEDPIGIAGGLNLYGYAGGDPVNFSDPFGLYVILHGPAAYRARMMASLRYIAERSETFRGIYNALIVSRRVNVRIGPDLLDRCNSSTDCTRRESPWSNTTRSRVIDQDDDLEMGFVAMHEILHAAGMLSTKVSSGVHHSCGNERDSSIAHACVWPLDEKIREEVRQTQEGEARRQRDSEGATQ
jgi:RHS repeat-associated protein